MSEVFGVVGADGRLRIYEDRTAREIDTQPPPHMQVIVIKEEPPQVNECIRLEQERKRGQR